MVLVTVVFLPAARAAAEPSGTGTADTLASPAPAFALIAPRPSCFPPEKPYDLAAALALFGGGALFYRFHLNENHPLLPSDKKSFIPQSVPEAYVGIGLAALSPLPFFTEGKKGFYHFRGYLFDAAACFFLYSFTTSATGRRRPNYDEALRLGEKAEKKSFFSGHATMSFSAATYTSLYLYKYASSRTASALAAVWLYSLAAYVAYTRYNEHYHHLSDIITGAAVGTGVSYVVFTRYEKKQRAGLRLAFFPLPPELGPEWSRPPAGIEICAGF